MKQYIKYPVLTYITEDYGIYAGLVFNPTVVVIHSNPLFDHYKAPTPLV